MRYLLSIALCLLASSAWAFPPGFIGAVTHGAATGGGSCSTPMHTATWTSPDTYISEWDESNGTTTNLSVSNDTMLLTQTASDTNENVILRDTYTTFPTTEYTIYFEYKISTVTGVNASDRQDLFITRSNALKQINLSMTSNSSGNITGLRVQDNTDNAYNDVAFSPSADTWYDFYIALKYSTGSNDGHVTVKYREHGAGSWTNGPTLTGRAYGASSTVDYIGIGLLTYDFWASGTITSNYDNWSLRSEICDSSNY